MDVEPLASPNGRKPTASETTSPKVTESSQRGEVRRRRGAGRPDRGRQVGLAELPEVEGGPGPAAGPRGASAFDGQWIRSENTSAESNRDGDVPECFCADVGVDREGSRCAVLVLPVRVGRQLPSV